MHIPKRYIESEPGIYTRVAYTDPTGEEIGQSYKDRAVKILQSDQEHYRRHGDELRAYLAKHNPDLTACASWGGGHPKLEATLGFEEVHVYDHCAEMYAETMGEFAKRYPDIKATWGDEINESVMESEQTPGMWNVFSHIIEHLTPEEGRIFLKSCKGNPIIIYGPNIERAQNDKWLHFTPADHNTFWSAPALKKYLQSLGYKRVTVAFIDEDYLVIASGRNAERSDDRSES